MLIIETNNGYRAILFAWKGIMKRAIIEATNNNFFAVEIQEYCPILKRWEFIGGSTNSFIKNLSERWTINAPIWAGIDGKPNFIISNNLLMDIRNPTLNKIGNVNRIEVTMEVMRELSNMPKTPKFKYIIKYIFKLKAKISLPIETNIKRKDFCSALK